MMKMMKDVELNQAKIHKLEADAILAIEQAGGVRTGQDIAMLDAQIGAINVVPYITGTVFPSANSAGNYANGAFTQANTEIGRAHV